MRSVLVCALLTTSLVLAGCALGPRMIEINRLRYNDSVKVTTERQLLLNIVRLRYIDTPSSLSVTTIAEQPEIVAGLKAIPFFTSAAAGNSFGGYAGSILPSAELSGAVRPTLSYSPLDDQEFTRRLFTPITLEGTLYISKTTWSASTVFRLYLENMNWVSNAETASGPTPRVAPDYEEFQSGIQALQRLQDRKLMAFFSEDREEKLTDPVPQGAGVAAAAVESAKAGFEYRGDSTNGWVVTRKQKQPILRIGAIPEGDADWAAFSRIFHLDPDCRSFDITTDSLDPFLAEGKGAGLRQIDLETRSLIQVLFFVSQGVDVPAEHVASGVAPSTTDADGTPFDWHKVMHGLLRVHCVAGKKPPATAHVAVPYKGHWFYIDESDRDSKSTFSLLMELSRLELGVRTGQQAPLLTLPLNGR